MAKEEGELKKRIHNTYDKEGEWFAQTPEEMIERLGIEDAKKEFPWYNLKEIREHQTEDDFTSDYIARVEAFGKKWFGSEKSP